MEPVFLIYTTNMDIGNMDNTNTGNMENMDTGIIENMDTGNMEAIFILAKEQMWTWYENDTVVREIGFPLQQRNYSDCYVKSHAYFW